MRYLWWSAVDKVIRDRRAENGQRTVQKPCAIDAYNQCMGGVDLLDQRMSYYRYPHRHMKWYMVVYHFMMEVALVNAYLSYRIATNDKSKTTRRFRMELINSLCATYAGPEKRGRRRLVREENRQDIEWRRLNERHFLIKIPAPSYRPNCVVCSTSRTRRQTSRQCRECDLPMCEDCFLRFHTLQKYK
eukprot:XP_011674396.1 PREDICTED: piggyBac transposable element-derived protein 4-like [Strongylocentrotus purpuratus]